MKKITIQLETLTCPSCLQKINNAVNKLEGISKDSVQTLFNASKVKLNYDETKIGVKTIEDAITKLGYEVKKSVIKDS